jgi:hypothetical protein
LPRRVEPTLTLNHQPKTDQRQIEVRLLVGAVEIVDQQDTRESPADALSRNGRCSLLSGLASSRAASMILKRSSGPFSACVVRMLSATSRTAGSRNRPGALEHHRAYHLPGAAERDHLRHVGVMGEIENAGGLRNVSPKREGCGERAGNPGLGFAQSCSP